MTTNIEMRPQREQQRWRALTIFGIILYLALNLIFVLFGRVNADEGWYLYASKLVYEGQRPYQDFAYTQTPLLPYIYGITQTLFPLGMYTGRITTFMLSTIAFFLSLSIARRHAGEVAATITALLWATFAYGIYFHAVVKTYALVILFFMFALFILSSKLPQNWKLILVTISVLLATLTRLSALLFAIPFLLYALTVASKKTRFITVALILIAVTSLLWLSLPNIEAAKWNIWTYHTSQWGDTSTIQKLLSIANHRLPNLLLIFPGYFLLFFVVILLGYKHILAYLKSKPMIRLGTIALLFFALAHFATGGFHIEYFITFIFALFPIAGILYVQIESSQQNYSKVILRTALLSCWALGLLIGGLYHIDTSGGQLPIEEIKEISTIITKNSNPEDRILALEALWVVIEADRKTMPNMTMAQFSLYDGDTSTANSLKLVNEEIILQYIENSIPKLIILTSFDWSMLRQTRNFEAIVTALHQHYDLQLTGTRFGQVEGTVEIYLRRED